MLLATTLRYMAMGTPTSPWNIRWYSSDDLMTLSKKYDVGIVALYTKTDLERICSQCDGLILPGSATNILPIYYNGAPLESEPPVDEYALDSALIQSFYEAGKPILGLCGGHQELNVFFGGTIRRMKDSKTHENDTAHTHTIQIEQGSFVYDAFGAESAEVNSYHAWELDRIAPDLSSVAVSADGVCEAVEWKKHHIYATQWHPELSLKGEPSAEHLLFENFLRDCEACR